MDEQLSELEKLQQAAQLIEEMSQGRLQVCPSVVGQVYIRPQHDSNLGMDMRIDSIPGQPHYRITFTVQLRRMGTDMVADDLRALLSEVGQTYALMAALEARRYPDARKERELEKYSSLHAFIREVAVPEMQIKLRQGFGRAIRTESDTCVIAILDERACRGRRYAQAVSEALPEMRRTGSLREVTRFLREKKPESYFEVGR